MSLGAKSSDAVEVSIGLAEWRPGQDWQTAYQNADVDLYEDKRRRKLTRREVTGERAKLRLLPRGLSVRRRIADS
jgi:hypothetical protein